MVSHGNYLPCTESGFASRELRPTAEGSGNQMDDLTLANMQARVSRCRWLAVQTTDEVTAAELRRMADEGQADIDRMLFEQAQPKIEMTPRTLR